MLNFLRYRVVETLIIVPMLVLFAVSAYYLYSSYKEYTQEVDTIAYAKYIKSLEALLYELKQEEVLYATYLGLGRGVDSEAVKKQITITDARVAEFTEFVTEHKNFQDLSEGIFEDLASYDRSRSLMFLLKRDYIDGFFNVNNSPSAKIVSRLNRVDLEMFSSSNREFIGSYINLTQLSTNSLSEQALVSYFISRSQPLSFSELETWDRLIGQDSSPQYASVHDRAVKSKLAEIFASKQYGLTLKKILKDRVQIFVDSDSGSFSIDLEDYANTQQSRVQAFKKAQADLIKPVIASSINSMAKTKKDILLAAIIMFVSLILAIIVHMIFSKMARDTKKLEEVLLNVKDNSSEQEQKHLRSMLARDDKSEIYNFMAQIIKQARESKKIAEEASNTKSLFLANMSHEIRTPLNGIVGFTQLLKSSSLDSEQEEFVQIIEKSSESLLSVINDILDLSKIESDKIDIEEIIFDPFEEFESAIENYGAKAAEKSIDLALYIDPDLSDVHLRGDSARIKQVLVNLISNAVKFTPVSGEIVVTIEKVSDTSDHAEIKFSIKDSGIGISDDQKDKIFEAFSQADSSTSRKFGGTGLGLTISSKLVENMGGKLELTSRVNVGTTFYFTLLLPQVKLADERVDISSINVGYYLPKERRFKKSDDFLKQYISSLDCKLSVVPTLDVIVKQELDLDVLFVDFDHARAAQLKKLISLGTKIVVLATTLQKDDILAINIECYRVLYAPIGYSKVKKSIEALKIDDKISIEESTYDKFIGVEVLVAEDNIINQKLAKRALEELGINVSVANNGKEAYILRQTQRFDLIFMDIQMPIMSGIEATHAILEYEKKNSEPHVPIVALTANALKGDKERFISEGLDQYIAKPMKIDEVMQILKYYLKENVVQAKQITKQGGKLGSKVVKIRPSSGTEYLRSVDILLCKHTPSEARIFRTLLKKIGYDVDLAEDIEEAKKLLKTNKYKYFLLDKNLDGLEGSALPELLDRLGVPSLLFVPSLQVVTTKDRKLYTHISVNVADVRLLRHLMAKLLPFEHDDSYML